MRAYLDKNGGYAKLANDYNVSITTVTRIIKHEGRYK